ncbi:hypothetical protein ColLi_05420 [Colletotrichum liriopes]|uniref:DUF7918 domain-containing protein n=1 Tax=Colletotrichum liriopes TaxID=708192 RepID=A0AA37GKT5_9PEZI|nr:hypothetical protein ColLi_05420 [Colletotrichum liriopes]
MAGFNFSLYVRVVIKINGQNSVEYDDPDAEMTELEAPFGCCKLIEIKEGASFSIDILLGRGIRDFLPFNNSGLMAIVHLDSQEVIRRLVTKKSLCSGRARQHRLLLTGVHEKLGQSRQALRNFRFATREKSGSVIKGSLRVDFFEPEPGNGTKKMQVADTYEVKRLKHGHPLASFVFKYRTEGALLADIKTDCNNNDRDKDLNDYGEDLIDLTDVRLVPTLNYALDSENCGLRQTSGTTFPSSSSLVARRESQVYMATKPSDDLPTLLDLEEKKDEMDCLYVPLQARSALIETEGRKPQTETEYDEAISIQSLCGKRKAASTFDNNSPPRPRKMIALSE